MERKFKRFHHLTYTDRLKIEQMYNGGAGFRRSRTRCASTTPPCTGS